jgi:CheY-like chemotaxis protein
MNGIMGFTQLLKNHDLPLEKKEEFLEIIESRSQHLLQIINDIIDISKIEANQFDVQKKDTSLLELLQHQSDFYSNLLKNNGNSHINLELEMQGLEEAVVHTDDVRLQQILSNLLDNAVKFTHQGHIRLGCRRYEKKRLLFYVRDTGIGIPKDKQHIVFDSFRQVDDSFTRTFEGTGLGLAITRKLVARLGGQIWLESEKNRGSTFYFTIPDVGLHDQEQEAREEEEGFPDLAGHTVLVVEDDSFSRRYLQELIKPTHARIILAEDGKSAWEKIRGNPSISIILMDIKLPDYNGLELTQKVKASYPRIKVIAQTAYAMSSDKPRALEYGCDAYISKPVRQKRLFQLIEQTLN